MKQMHGRLCLDKEFLGLTMLQVHLESLIYVSLDLKKGHIYAYV